MMDGMNGVVSAMAFGGRRDEVHQGSRNQGASGDDERDGPGAGEPGAGDTAALPQGAGWGIAAQRLE